MEKNPPCEGRLLTYEMNNINYKTFPVPLKGSKVRILYKNKFLVIIPNKLVSCNQEKDNISLYQQYLIELPLQCKIDIGNLFMTNLEKMLTN